MNGTWKAVVFKRIGGGVLDGLYVMVGLLFFGVFLPTVQGWITPKEYDYERMVDWLLWLMKLGLVYGVVRAVFSLLGLSIQAHRNRRARMNPCSCPCDGHASEPGSHETEGDSDPYRKKLEQLHRLMMTATKFVCILALTGILVWLEKPHHGSNESWAIGTLRTISYAQEKYYAAKKTYGTFADLMTANPPFLDGDNWTKEWFEYRHLLTLEDGGQTFEAVAVPKSPGLKTGIFTFRQGRSFYIDNSMVLRWATPGTVADEHSPPIGE